MRLSSEKFKYLDLVAPYLEVGTIPPYKIVTGADALGDIYGQVSTIMRSALKNEAGAGSLLSGKSLSIGGIDSPEKLREAWEKVSAQEDLQEVILQEEVSWDTHATIICEEEFFLAELKDRTGAQRIIYWSPIARSQEAEVEPLRRFLKPLATPLRGKDIWLLELGIRSDRIFLFQVHPISPKLLNTLFSSELVAQIVASRMRFAKAKGPLGLLNMELKARKFRQTIKKSFHPSQVFLNWEYLFHYFRLFCMMNRLTPDAHGFALFLSESYKDNWLGTLVQKHLELANLFRKDETFNPLRLGMEGAGPVFIGKGVIEGVVGTDIYYCDEIPLDLPYRKVKPKAILTKEVGVLSHPVLASVESNIALVLGINAPPREGTKIYLDFEKKILRIP